MDSKLIGHSEESLKEMEQRRASRIARLRRISEQYKNQKESDSARKYRQERFYRWMGKRIKTDDPELQGVEFQYEDVYEKVKPVEKVEEPPSPPRKEKKNASKGFKSLYQKFKAKRKKK